MSDVNHFGARHFNDGSFSDGRSAGVVRLAELFPDATRTGAGEVVVTSCVTDWREVEPGDVFVALPDCGNDGDDGHLHAQRAVSHGAIAVVCEQPVPVFDVPTYLVPDSRVAVGEICHALLGHPSRTLEVIGVTGTHGKSTTIALLESIFAAAGKHCGKLSSLGCYDGMTHSAGMGDAPSAPAFASRLSRMEAAGCTHAFVEISSQALSQVRVAGMELGAVVVTNVTDAHLDCHNTVQSYRETKRRILEYLSPTGVTILNVDDPVSLKWLDQVAGPVLTYGLEQPFGNTAAEITATVVSCHANEQTFVLTAGGDSVAVRTTIVGEHHVANCLAAATLSLSYGIDLQTIAAGLEAVESLPARMERVDCGQGFPVFIDAADTPEALRASLRVARRLAERRVICVWDKTAGGTDSEHLAISQVLNRLADLAIVTQPLPRPESADADVEVVADRSEAIACAVAIAEPGDVVVIAGSRATPAFDFGDVDESITDREITRQLLYARELPTFRLVG
ncbi:MAG: UDP-N-acetylmuramyl-tripeptide synthetase [Planctomycetes bacterium]|nr:UDP-N-acetylmuramyl-tripeptide synthetase [Planctomycetota bacterium]